MRLILLPFALLAALGLALSIACHAAALAGAAIPGGDAVWALHAGIFVVWLPAVVLAKRMARHGRRADFWKLALSGCPAWARYALYGLFGYALLNFIHGMSTHASDRHGADAMDFEAQVRLFSGHWMVFYGAALATLCSAIRRPQLLARRRCANGHEVGALDEFCAKCGAKCEPPAAAGSGPG
jgi:hypothetical protein